MLLEGCPALWNPSFHYCKLPVLKRGVFQRNGKRQRKALSMQFCQGCNALAFACPENVVKLLRKENSDQAQTRKHALRHFRGRNAEGMKSTPVALQMHCNTPCELLLVLTFLVPICMSQSGFGIAPGFPSITLAH